MPTAINVPLTVLHCWEVGVPSVPPKRRPHVHKRLTLSTMRAIPLHRAGAAVAEVARLPPQSLFPASAAPPQASARLVMTSLHSRLALVQAWLLPPQTVAISAQARAPASALYSSKLPALKAIAIPRRTWALTLAAVFPAARDTRVRAEAAAAAVAEVARLHPHRRQLLRLLLHPLPLRLNLLAPATLPPAVAALLVPLRRHAPTRTTAPATSTSPTSSAPPTMASALGPQRAHLHPRLHPPHHLQSSSSPLLVSSPQPSSPCSSKPTGEP